MSYEFNIFVAWTPKSCQANEAVNGSTRRGSLSSHRVAGGGMKFSHHKSQHPKLVGGDWNIFYDFPILSIYWECHHPNWRTHSIIFQRGRLNHQPENNRRLFRNSNPRLSSNDVVDTASSLLQHGNSTDGSRDILETPSLGAFDDSDFRSHVIWIYWIYIYIYIHMICTLTLSWMSYNLQLQHHMSFAHVRGPTQFLGLLLVVSMPDIFTLKPMFFRMTINDLIFSGLKRPTGPRFLNGFVWNQGTPFHLFSQHQCWLPNPTTRTEPWNPGTLLLLGLWSWANLDMFAANCLPAL